MSLIKKRLNSTYISSCLFIIYSTMEVSPPKLTKDILYAVDNSRHRAFIPSMDNIFGGYNVGVIMVDTGCNSHLLRIEPNSIKDIISKFPVASHEYKVYSKSVGTGLVSSATLIVTPRGKVMIQCELSRDLCPFLMTSNMVRFSLCYDDAIELTHILNTDKDFKIVNSNTLKTYITTIEMFKKIDKDAGRRRHHSLLGRSAITKLKNSLVMRDEVTMIGEDELLMSITTDQIWDFKDICMNSAEKNIEVEGMKFNDLEDEYSEDVRDSKDLFIDE